MQARKYRINWDICNPYAGVAGMLLMLEMESSQLESLNHLFFCNYFIFDDETCEITYYSIRYTF